MLLATAAQVRRVSRWFPPCDEAVQYALPSDSYAHRGHVDNTAGAHSGTPGRCGQKSLVRIWFGRAYRK